MTSQSAAQLAKEPQGPKGFPVEVVCPACHGDLTANLSGLVCMQCGRQYGLSNTFPDLVIGERFDDQTSLEKILYEERSNADLTLNYFLPLFRKMWANPARPPRLLSLGCGSGVDVDLLTEHGFECIGIDCGNRSRVWERRHQKSRLLLANGKHLPFPDCSFDAVFCGCVFPHVGVIGDSSCVSPSYFQERLTLAGEMARVLNEDGKILVSSPNRLFPLDLFHGREEGSLKPKFNRRSNPFLLSMRDYQELFAQVGFGSAQALPPKNYWGFIRSKHSWKGRLLGMPVRSLFWSVSALPFLRNTMINPWLVLLMERTQA